MKVQYPHRSAKQLLQSEAPAELPAGLSGWEEWGHTKDDLKFPAPHLGRKTCRNTTEQTCGLLDAMNKQI